MPAKKEVGLLSSSWLGKALCSKDKTIDPEIFFSESRESQTKAIIICLSCPVKQACLDDALTVHVGGIRGASTENERRKLDYISLINLLNARVKALKEFRVKNPVPIAKKSNRYLPKMFIH